VIGKLAVLEELEKGREESEPEETQICNDLTKVVNDFRDRHMTEALVRARFNHRLAAKQLQMTRRQFEYALESRMLEQKARG
jgi:transcriptional regulator with PAS, ATPase and Fis domain